MTEIRKPRSADDIMQRQFRRQLVDLLRDQTHGFKIPDAYKQTTGEIRKKILTGDTNNPPQV